MLASRPASRIITSTRCVMHSVQTSREFGVWSKVSEFFTTRGRPPETITLLDGESSVFSPPTCHSDKEFKGESSSRIETVNESGKSFHRWSGELSFTEDVAAATNARGGFAAIQLPCKKPVDLLEYICLDIELRTTNDLYLTINMTNVSLLQGDIFQFPFKLKASPNFQTFHVPFHFFLMTAQGKFKYEPRENDRKLMEGLGFLITTNRCPSGPFQVDIGKIVATMQQENKRRVYTKPDWGTLQPPLPKQAQQVER